VVTVPQVPEVVPAPAVGPAPAVRSGPAAGHVTPPAPAVPQARPTMRYVVVPGDSLSRIAKMKKVPGGWQALHERNKDKVTNPSALKIGQELDVDN
ncbi:MAG: LysM peptidoglycan-binding domain-containing protein, partial [Actinomycetota bacterium]|nr:LysM peptidoglycan-binding domain-containing protein [Actinomycetota bacterium]